MFKSKKKFLLLPFFVLAIVFVLSLAQSRAYANSNYLTIDPALIHAKVKEKFPSFNMDLEEFQSQVPGYSKYKILEITPRHYVGAETEVSDLSDSLSEIKTAASKFNADQYMISNLSRFEVDTMTIKEFNSSRIDLAGQYDAVVFAAGPYSVIENACSIESVENIGQKITEYKNGGSGKKIYEGYRNSRGENHGEGISYFENGNKSYEGTWKNGEYHGFGTIYHNNGRVKYEGYFFEGERTCYGEEFDDNNRLIFRGKWKDNKHNGYGTIFEWVLDVLRIIFEGFFDDGVSQEDIYSYDIQNDLTALKANELLESYMDLGLPVFVHQDALKDRDSVLYQTFNPLVNNNSIYSLNYEMTETSGNMDFETLASLMLITEVTSQKPYIELLKKPSDYLDGGSKAYMDQELLNFEVNLANQDHGDLRLYIDINQNNVIEEFEVAHAQPVTRGSNTFSHKVPSVLPGLLKYRISVTSGDFETSIDGTFKVDGPTQEIKVLNIVTDIVKHRNGLLDQNLVNEYFKNNGDYNINVTTCDAGVFSKSYGWWEKFLGLVNKDCSYEHLDRYDVILLGQDIFKHFDLKENVHLKIKEEVNKGKPIIFTSQFTDGHESWYTYYKDNIALSNERTDSYTLNNIDQLQIMNDYSYVTYPFNLHHEDLSIPKELNFALNEEYQIDLNNPQLVPLLNMYQKSPYKFDRFDSYNNFYYIKKDNAVYLNVGTNSFDTYTDLEHKMIANAIINGFIEHRGKARTYKESVLINVPNNPYVNKIVDVDDQVQFNFSSAKINVKEKNEILNYKLYVNNVLIKQEQIQQNQSIQVDLTGKLPTPRVGRIEEALVYLVVEDSKFLTKTYQFSIYISNINQYADITQGIVGTIPYEGKQYSQVHSPVDLTYQIRLKDIDVSHLDPIKLQKTITMDQLKFKLQLPEGLNASLEDNKDFVIQSNVVTRLLGDIVYNLNDQGYYVPSRRVFDLKVKVKPNTGGSFTLDQASIEYNGIGDDQEKQTFGSVNFNSKYALNDTMVQFGPDFNKDVLFIPYRFPEPKLSNYFIINKVDTIITETLFNGSANDGYNTSKRGIFSYTLELKDIFGNRVRKNFTIITYNPIENLEVSGLDVELNHSKDLVFLTDPIVHLDDLKVEWVDQSQKVAKEVIDPLTGKITIKGINIGNAKLRISGYDEYGNIISEEVMINVYSKLRFKTSQLTKVMFVGSKLEFPEYVVENPVPGYKVKFTVDNEAVVSIVEENDKVMMVGLAPGVATVTATLYDSEGNSTGDAIALIVKVSDSLSNQSGFRDDLITDGNIIVQAFPTPYHLSSFINIYPKDAYNVTMTFTVNGVELTNDEFAFTEINEYYDVAVKIVQVKDNGEVIEVDDTVRILVVEVHEGDLY